MDINEIKKLQAATRIGGKGTPRLCKKKYSNSNQNKTTDNKLETALKKLQLNAITGVDRIDMIRNDNTFFQFEKPKVQGSSQSKIYSINGSYSVKKLDELMPEMLSQISPEEMSELQKLAEQLEQKKDSEMTHEDDDIPELVEDIDTE